MRKATYVLLAFVIMLCGACKKKEKTPEPLQEITLEQKLNQRITQMSTSAELGTVEYTVKKVVMDSVINKKWYEFGVKKIMFRCTAYLKAGIDMNDFDPAKTKIDEKKKSVVITLPKAKLLSLNIPPENSEIVYEKRTGTRRDWTVDERNELLKLGEKSIKEDVPNLGILNDAENNARDFFKALLGQLGFKSIIVKFE